MRPNVRAKRANDGKTPGSGRRKCTAYHRPRPGGLPLARRLSEGLGGTRGAMTMFLCLTQKWLRRKAAASADRPTILFVACR